MRCMSVSWQHNIKPNSELDSTPNSTPLRHKKGHMYVEADLLFCFVFFLLLACLKVTDVVTITHNGWLAANTTTNVINNRGGLPFFWLPSNWSLTHACVCVFESFNRCVKNVTIVNLNGIIKNDPYSSYTHTDTDTYTSKHNQF